MSTFQTAPFFGFMPRPTTTDAAYNRINEFDDLDDDQSLTHDA